MRRRRRPLMLPRRLLVWGALAFVIGVVYGAVTATPEDIYGADWRY